MQAGSYVVCINDSNWDKLAYKKMSELPVKGKIYRIRRVIPNFDTNCYEDGVALEGIFGEWDFYTLKGNIKIFEEFHFIISRFKEIEDPFLFEDVLEEVEVDLLCEV
jgi:hypothetical protein